MMKPAHRFHFMPNKDSEEAKALAQNLITDLGQNRIGRASIIVPIGGDGKLLEAFSKAKPHQQIFGITPPRSNSHGFWPDHTVSNAQDLLDCVTRAGTFLIAPLKGKIHFSKGVVEEAFAYNDIMIEKAGGQLPLFNLTASFDGAVRNPARIMGYYLFSTAYGSSSGSMRYGGSIISIRQNVILATGKGVTSPEILRPSIVDMQGTNFHVDFISAGGKRPVHIECDGKRKAGDKKKGYISALDVSAAPERAVQFLTLHNPNGRAFSASMPV